MSERNLLIPILLVVVVGAPIVYHEMKSQPQATAPTEDPDWSNPGYSPSFSQTHSSSPDTGSSPQGPGNFSGGQSLLPTRNISRPHVVPAEQPFQLSGYSKNVENPVQHDLVVNPANGSRTFDPRSIPIRGSEGNSALPRPVPVPSKPIVHSQPAASLDRSPATSFPQTSSPIVTNSQPFVNEEHIDFSNMTPDYGAAQTFVFPGNELGPDLTAEPLEYLPVQDFSEIFQFNLTKSWVQRRWKRISTNPTDFRNEFSGMRIPLVTGTNTWDLHGSLTYYFDNQQQLQRITFRGWTGDPQKLLNLLTSQYQFKPQPTTLAGFYLGETRRKTHGGIMLKSPPVIDANNPFQQYGIVMEMNRPEGQSELSDEYRRLIAGSHPQ